jgi:tripartite ATP-independent transporter DctP family solute receptor
MPMPYLKSSHPGRRRMVASGLAAAVLTAPHIARAAIRIARFGHNNVDESHFGQGAFAFAAAVAADPLLGNALTIEVYGNAQLGDDPYSLNGCMRGTLDGMLVSGSIMAGVVADVGILNAPYLFRDVARARAVLDGPIGADLTEACRAKNLPVLAWGENGLRHITSNTPIHALADLRGLKIRVPPSDMFLQGFRALGANPAPLAFGLLRAALLSGEFQAQENAVVLVEAAKLYEVQKYLCLTGHIYDAIGFVASPDLMEDLTAPQREALVACARKGAAVTRRVADAAARDGVARLRAAGMTIIDDIDIGGLQAACRPFLETLAATYGADRVRSLLAAAGGS